MEIKWTKAECIGGKFYCKETGEEIPREQHIDLSKPIGEVQPSGATKDTRGKPEVDLVPLELLECLSEPLMYGKLKGYEKNNWLKGIPFSVSLAAMLRHLTLWQNKVDLDEEATSKGGQLHHINAALHHLASIALMTKRGRTDLDDR